MLKKINYFIHKIKYLLEFPERFSREKNEMWNYLIETRRLINENTTIHCDYSYKGVSQVIVLGQYKGKNYVRTFNIKTQSLGGLIEILKSEEAGARVGRFDISPTFDFRAVYPDERF